MMYPKPSRVKDRGAIEAQRKDACEVCGRWGPTQVHHVVSKGSGGPDRAENLVALCADCHRLAHAEHITKDELWAVIAAREGMPIANVRRVCYQDRQNAHTSRRQ